MATHTNFLEQNATATDGDGIEYPVWQRESMLGKVKTIEIVSAWQLSADEQAAVDESGLIFVRIVAGQPPMLIYWADSVEFEGQNAVFKHPDCKDLPVFKRDITHKGQPTFDITSAWQLRPYGKQEVAFNQGVIFLSVVGGQPTVEVFGINPIDELNRDGK